MTARNDGGQITTLRINLVIDQLRISGLSSLDASRLVDRLEGELRRLAPELADVRTGQRGDVNGGAVTRYARIERSAEPLARAIVTAVRG
jgi:hypothetical protein